MELYGHQSKSIPQKITIHVIELIFIWLTYWILFQHGAAWCERYLHIHNTGGGSGRRIILFVFNTITFLRIAYTMTFLLRRKIPWEESISVPFAFAVYYIGFSLFVLPVSKPVNGWVYFAILLFLTGSVLNSVGELLRDRWKKRPENKGKIYTGGLFSLSRHINYFGDILWVTGYALVTGNVYAAILPVLLFLFFALYNAPKLDEYLKHKYGKEYADYAARTRMLIPFIY